MKYVLVALINLIAGIFVAHYYSNFTTAMAVKLDRSIDQVFPLVAVETTVNVDDQPQKLLFYIRWRQNDAAGLGSEWAVDRDPATGALILIPITAEMGDVQRWTVVSVYSCIKRYGR